MHILIDITHPADVHFFSRPMANWRAAGHSIEVVARDKDIVLPLLAELGVPCRPVGRAGHGPLGLAVELLQRETQLLRLMHARRPDVVCGFGGTFLVHPAWLLGVPCIVFTDTEIARVANAIAFPFASLVCTPRAYPRLRRPQLRFAGYKELAYLHPRYFTPDPCALRDAGLTPGEPFVFMRLVAWQSAHDFFDHGLRDVRAAVRRLQRFARVVLSAEGPLPADLEPLRLRGPLHRVHHVMAFARLYIGESATMGAESAVLGTPALVVSTSRRSYLDELTARYGLAFCYDDRRSGQAQALARAEAVLTDPQNGSRWRERRARMLAEQEDVAEMVTDVVTRHGSPARRVSVAVGSEGGPGAGAPASPPGGLLAGGNDAKGSDDMETIVTPLGAAALLVGLATLASAQARREWPLHDESRPQPKVIDPGPSSTDRPAPAPSDATVLFDGRDLANWRSKADGSPAKWKVENGYMEVVAKAGDIQTAQGFGDCQLHLEWATPSPGVGEEQHRGNSGVFLMGLYEVQVLDSYNNKTYPDGQAAAIYGQYPPLVNASRPPGQWQTYDMVFRAPRFDTGGKLLRPARITVLHNGILVHDNRELTGPTAHQSRPPYKAHPEKLPLGLQDHGDPVRYRNIWIRELPEE